jgi:predicted enzyme related to lactoylglutathione lyase
VYLENLVVDARDPRALGRFWEAVLHTETLTDEPAGFETRLAVPGGPVLDLCFQPVPNGVAVPQRLRVGLDAGAALEEVLPRLGALGARQSQVGEDRVVLTDPEGYALDVGTGSGAGTVTLAGLRLEVADPARDQQFWSWLSGWPATDDGSATLRHRSGRGPVLALRAEAGPKGSGKNRLHLDVRLEPGDDVDAVAREIGDRGGRELHFDWGDLPWRHFADPSGNEFCVLPASG